MQARDWFQPALAALDRSAARAGGEEAFWDQFGRGKRRTAAVRELVTKLRDGTEPTGGWGPLVEAAWRGLVILQKDGFL